MSDKFYSKVENICTKYGLIKIRENYFSMNTFKDYFIVRITINKSLMISCEWVINFKEKIIVPCHPVEIRLDNLEEQLVEYLEEYKQLQLLLKRHNIEKDFA